MAITREARIRKEMVRQKSSKSIPAIPPVRARGIKTATVVRVEAVREVKTSRVPSTQDSIRLCPSADQR